MTLGSSAAMSRRGVLAGIKRELLAPEVEA
jgi:hypothetical protein